MVYWSADVQREWKRHLVDDAGYSEVVIERTQRRMEAAFPLANVQGYEVLMPLIQLPDVDDRHVLAAAMKAEVDTLVTFNLKDFPESALPVGMAVQHPDEVLVKLLETNPEGCRLALSKLIFSLKTPPLTLADIATALEKNQKPRTAAILRNFTFSSL